MQKRGPRPAVEKTLREKVQKQTFPPSLEIPQKARGSHFPTAPTAADVFLQRPRPKTQTRRKSHYPWTKNGGQVNGTTAEDVGSGPEADRSGTKSKVGKGTGSSEKVIILEVNGPRERAIFYAWKSGLQSEPGQ